MTELGVGYLSIVADTSKIPGQINSALGGAQSSANSAGEGMGSKLAAGLSKTLKVGVAAAGIAAGGLLASSLHKGIGRLSAIDDAQGKLTSLGNSTTATAKIMDSALAAVKGTSYGLGDAATIAASAVAAGVKPGQDLTRYLGLTADAASIAGVSLQEMGQIINKVQTSGTAYTMEITQLADRGLPIWQWLATEMKKPQAEMKKLVSEGKVDSATYLRAIENNIGGAATAATTVSSAWANLGAAQGRFGATIAGPIFRQAIPAFLGLTKAVDDLDAKAKPIMATFEKNLTGKYIPAVLEFGERGVEAFDKFRNSDFAVQSMSRLGNVLDQLMETGREVGPSISSIVGSLSKTSAALGVSTWQIFLSTLDASAQILDSTLVPVLNVTAGLLENNQGAVVALGAAWLLFKTIPAIVGRVTGAIAPMTSGVRSATTATAGYRASLSAMRGDFRNLAPQIGVTGAAMRSLGNNSSTIRGMQNAFIGSSTAAGGFASAIRVGVTPAMSALKSGASSAVSAIGGPFVATLMAATVLVMNYQSGVAKASSQNRILADSMQDAATAQGELLKVMASGDEVGITSQLTANMKALRQEQQQLADTGSSRVQQSVAVLDSLGKAIGITRGETSLATVEQDKLADSGEAISGTLDRLKIGNEVLSVAVSGSTSAYEKLRAQLLAAGPDGIVTASWLEQQRDEYFKLKRAMEQIGPVGVAVQDGLKQIADSAGDSKSKLGGLKTVLQGLGILKTDTITALAETAETVRDLAEAATKGADPVGGLGNALLGLDSGFDLTKPNAIALVGSLEDLGNQFMTLASNGETSAQAYEKIAPGLESLAETYKLPIAKVKELAEQFGIMPDVVDTALVVEGGPEAYQAITTLKLMLDQIPDGQPRVVNMRVEDKAAIDALRNAGNIVDELTDQPGFIRVTAKTELFDAGIAAVTQRMNEVGAKPVSAQIIADTTVFKLADGEVRTSMQGLRKEVADPKIGAVLDDFIAGRNVALSDIQKLDTSKASPEVILLIEQALKDAQKINDAIDQAAKPRTAVITAELRRLETIDPNLPAWSQERADAIWGNGPGAYAGMRVPGYKTGGKLPTTGPGTDRVDGFLGIDSNGIPTARVNRGEWVINDRSSEMYDRELASINAGTFPKLPGYESGGVVGSRDLTDFVTGRIPGVKPLTGDPYVFGGINWGDCSAAMSAIARFAVGLAPFAARFATGNMGPALAGMGFRSGRGGPGDLRFGWYNGGPYGGHTAGTLADGTNVEMGGGYGGGMVGGTVGSNHSSFTNHAFMPISASTSVRGRKAAVWSEKQEADLQAAEIAVRKAEEARVEVEQAVTEGKKTQTDLDDANNKVSKAQIKLTDMQSKKDGILDGTANAPAPQAPALSRMFTDAEVDRIDAQLAVQSANERRNDVYNDPQSSDDEIDKADAELYLADKALRELGMPKAGDGPTSWSGIAGDFAKAAASGFVSDALGVFGIPDEMPPALQAMKMFEEAQAAQNPHLIEPSANERAMGAQVATSPSMIAADSPAIYNPAEGIARWGDSVARGQDGVGALLAEIDRFRGAARYAGGGSVSGESGVDKVPAWLTAREFVVNAIDANAGQNPMILDAMNAGAKFTLGQQNRDSGRGNTTNNFFGIQNPEEVVQRLRVKDMQDAASHGWGIR